MPVHIETYSTVNFILDQHPWSTKIKKSGFPQPTPLTYIFTFTEGGSTPVKIRSKDGSSNDAQGYQEWWGWRTPQRRFCTRWAVESTPRWRTSGHNNSGRSIRPKLKRHGRTHGRTLHPHIHPHTPIRNTLILICFSIEIVVVLSSESPNISITLVTEGGRCIQGD